MKGIRGSVHATHGSYSNLPISMSNSVLPSGATSNVHIGSRPAASPESHMPAPPATPKRPHIFTLRTSWRPSFFSLPWGREKRKAEVPAAELPAAQDVGAAQQALDQLSKILESRTEVGISDANLFHELDQCPMNPPKADAQRHARNFAVKYTSMFSDAENSQEEQEEIAGKAFEYLISNRTNGDGFQHQCRKRIVENRSSSAMHEQIEVLDRLDGALAGEAGASRKEEALQFLIDVLPRLEARDKGPSAQHKGLALLQSLLDVLPPNIKAPLLARLMDIIGKLSIDEGGQKFAFALLRQHYGELKKTRATLDQESKRLLSQSFRGVENRRAELVGVDQRELKRMMIDVPSNLRLPDRFRHSTASKLSARFGMHPVQYPKFDMKGIIPDSAESSSQSWLRELWRDGRKLGMDDIRFPDKLAMLLHFDQGGNKDKLEMLHVFLSRVSEWSDYRDGEPARKREILRKIFGMLEWVEKTAPESIDAEAGSTTRPGAGSRNKFFREGIAATGAGKNGGEILSRLWLAMRNEEIANGSGDMNNWDVLMKELHQQFVEIRLKDAGASLYKDHIEKSLDMAGLDEAGIAKKRQEARSTVGEVVEVTLGRKFGLTEVCHRVSDEKIAAMILPELLADTEEALVQGVWNIKEWASFIGNHDGLKKNPVFKEEHEKELQARRQKFEEVENEVEDFFDADDDDLRTRRYQASENYKHTTKDFLNQKINEFGQRQPDFMKRYFPDWSIGNVSVQVAVDTESSRQDDESAAL